MRKRANIIMIMSDLFTNSYLIDTLCRMLSLKDLLALSQLSRTAYRAVQQVSQRILTQMHLPLIPLKTATHLFRFYFDRCLHIYKDTGLLKTIENPFKYQTIVVFQAGTKFVGFLNHENTLFIMTLSEILVENRTVPPPYLTIHQVGSFSCKGNRLYYCLTNGRVFSRRCPQQTILEPIEPQEVGWTNRIPIDRLVGSYCNLVYVPNRAYQNMSAIELSAHLFGQKEGQNRHEDQIIMPIPPASSRQNSVAVSSESCEDKCLIVQNMNTGRCLIVKCPCQDVIQCVVGQRQLYIITKDSSVFVANLEGVNPGLLIVMATQFVPLAGKKILKMFSGFNYFIALEQFAGKSLQTMTCDHVVDQLDAIGLSEFRKILKVEKIDGKKIQTVTPRYLSDTIGMSKPANQLKLFQWIKKVKTYENRQQLYGWGFNHSAQLASQASKIVAHPRKIKCEVLAEGDQIDQIFCGWNETFLRTKKGYIFTTLTKTIRQKKPQGSKSRQNLEVESNGEEFQEEKQFKPRRKNTQHKERNEDKLKNCKKYEEEPNWEQCPNGKAFFVAGLKNCTLFVQCPSHHRFEPNRENKLRTIKSVLHRLTWDHTLVKSDYVLGYYDRELGLVEIEFTSKEVREIKENRIKYVKRGKHIIWDREQKIDRL